MSKYIIKNCPAIFYSGIIDGAKCWQKWEHFDESCENCPDCLLKQIVEKCQEAQDKEYRKGSYKFRSPSKASFGREILQLMDIKEVE